MKGECACRADVVELAVSQLSMYPQQNSRGTCREVAKKKRVPKSPRAAHPTVELHLTFYAFFRSQHVFQIDINTQFSPK
jgi:hypothetical protein